jgi:hypothetical protein
MSYPPKVFFIGAEKCGTTTICDLIAQHPGVDISDPRDADYFTRNFDKGEDWYRSLFDPAEDKISIDCSLSYAAAPLGESPASGTGHLVGVPGRIKAFRPDARFIYSVREPASRTYSAYWHARRFNHEDRSFDDAVKKQGRYLEISDYAGQMEKYLEHFPIESFHFILFEDLSRDPVGVAKRCLDFLGLDPEAVEIAFERPKNQSFQYNTVGRTLQKVAGSGARMEAVLRTVKSAVPPALVPRAKALLTKKVPSIDDADRHWLKDYFAGRVSRFRDLSGLDLSAWNRA